MTYSQATQSISKNDIRSGKIGKPIDITLKQWKVLNLLSQGGSAKSISTLLKTSQPSLSRMIKKLEAHDYLKISKPSNKNYTYNMTQKGSLAITNWHKSKSLVAENPFRLHALQIKVTIPFNHQARWSQYLSKSFTIKDYEEKSLGNHIEKTFYLYETRITTTPKSILIFPDDIFAPTAEECYKILTEKLNKIIPTLEDSLKFKVTKDNMSNIEIARQELARMNDEMATEFNERKKWAVIKVGEDRRIMIDFSNKIPEFEAVHKRHAQDDMKSWTNLIDNTENAKDLIKDTITGKFNHRELMEVSKKNESLMERIERQNAMISENILNFSKYLNQHIEIMSLQSAVLKKDLKQREIEEQKNRFVMMGKQKSVLHFTL